MKLTFNKTNYSGETATVKYQSKKIGYTPFTEDTKNHPVITNIQIDDEFHESRRYFANFAKRLPKATEKCHSDMHVRGDSSELEVAIVGSYLNNAMGDLPIDNCDELIIRLGNEKDEQWFNLASIIALARIGAKMQVNHDEFNSSLY